LSNLSGAGKFVQRETIKMLRNIMVMKKSDITDELQKKIKNTLYSMKDTWIIE